MQRLTAGGIGTLVFTGGEDPYLVRLAAAAGVLGVVRKSETNAVVVQAIRAAAFGEQVVTTDWAAAIDSDPALSEVGLSPPATACFGVVRLRGGDDGTGRPLDGSGNATVTEYLQRIRTKYAEAGRPAPSKTDLYKRALEDGYLPIPPRRPDRR